MRRNNCGFTLIELLISLIISGMIVLIAGQALKMNLVNTEKGAEKLEKQLRSQAIKNLIRKQLSSIYPYKINDKENFFFKGNHHQMMFVSSFSLTDHYRQGHVVVLYRVLSDNQYRLTCWESPLLHEEQLRKLWQTKDLNFNSFESDKKRILLFQECEAVFVDFLDEAEGKKTVKWVTEWKENHLPKAIRLNIQKKDCPTMTLLAPIMVTS